MINKTKIEKISKYLNEHGYTKASKIIHNGRFYENYELSQKINNSGEILKTNHWNFIFNILNE